MIEGEIEEVEGEARVFALFSELLARCACYCSSSEHSTGVPIVETSQHVRQLAIVTDSRVMCLHAIEAVRLVNSGRTVVVTQLEKVYAS